MIIIIYYVYESGRPVFSFSFELELNLELACVRIGVFDVYVHISWPERPTDKNNNNNNIFLLLWFRCRRRLNRNIVIIIKTYKIVPTRRMRKTDRYTL